MKKLTIILMICSILFLLTSCGMSRDEATEYVDSMTKSDYYGFNSDLEKYVEQKNFQKAVSDVLQNSTPSECFRLFDNLNEFYDGEDEKLKDFFQGYLSELKEQVFSDTADITFDEYVDLVCKHIGEYEYDWKNDALAFVPIKNENYYASFEDCLPYEQTVEYIKTRGETPVFENGHGGYYDDKQDDYESTSKLIDPLGISEGKGGIGTMRETQDYFFHGDFLVSEHHERWYGTSSSGDIILYFRGNIIFRDPSAKSYLNVLMDTDTYMIPQYRNDEIDDYMPCVVESDKIMFTGTKGFLVFDYSK